MRSVKIIDLEQNARDTGYAVCEQLFPGAYPFVYRLPDPASYFGLRIDCGSADNQAAGRRMHSRT